MNTGGTPSATGKVGVEQAAPAGAAAAGKPATVNERTYQEVEYLKKNLGPILVAALAEICIRRPADPIEYLGHWLLRWRYNEELKRRDVQNALDVVRQRQWAQVQDETAVAKVEKYADGFTPDQPHGPPGYGGPLSGEELGENGQKEVEEAEFHPPEEITGEGAEITGEGGALHPSQHLASGPPEDFSRKSRKSFQRSSMDEGSERRTSQGQAIPADGERKTSLTKDGVLMPPPPGERKPSLEPPKDRRASEGEKRASLSGAPQPVLPAPSAAAPPPAPAPEGERRVSLEAGQPRKNSKAPESIGSAPPTDAGSVGGEPPGGRKLSDASKQPPPPPPAE